MGNIRLTRKHSFFSELALLGYSPDYPLLQRQNTVLINLCKFIGENKISIIQRFLPFFCNILIPYSHHALIPYNHSHSVFF